MYFKNEEPQTRKESMYDRIHSESLLRPKGASTLCRVAKVARHMPLMRSCPHEKRIF